MSGPRHGFTRTTPAVLIFPPVGELLATPWGWGSTSLDYDNDGDSDTLYHGGLHMGFINALDNPGVMFQNTGRCTGRWAWDQDALERSHTRRGVEGVASGDLNRDGFPDVVSVSGFTVPEAHELTLFSPWGGTPFDAVAFHNELLAPLNDLAFGPGKEFRFEGKVVERGDLVVEVNRGDNGNHWIAVRLRGAVGLTERGVVNRDGVGATVKVTPEGGGTSAIRPIAAGGPYASQDALEKMWGLGQALQATVEVLWPGGVRNRLYKVMHSERVVIPEIPCSYDGIWETQGQYLQCVEQALNDLVQAGIIEPSARGRLTQSAVRAFQEP